MPPDTATRQDPSVMGHEDVDYSLRTSHPDGEGGAGPRRTAPCDGGQHAEAATSRRVGSITSLQLGNSDGPRSCVAPRPAFARPSFPPASACADMDGFIWERRARLPTQRVNFTFSGGRLVRPLVLRSARERLAQSFRLWTADGACLRARRLSAPVVYWSRSLRQICLQRCSDVCRPKRSSRLGWVALV